MLSRPDTDQTREELARALDDLARLAREGIPGCGSASVTVLHEGDARTMSSSDDRALAIDEEQYGGESGPCLSAMREREIVDVPDYTSERRWPNVTARGRGLGVHSGLSLPLEGDGNVLGALNLYGDTVAAFGESSLVTAALPAGSLLLLYTDGLVETRTRSFDDGIKLLAAALADQCDDQTPAQTCDALLRALVGDDPEDDVAVLAIRVDV